MEYLDQLMGYQVVDGTTVGDLFTVRFLIDIAGQVMLASVILIVGFFWQASSAAGLFGWRRDPVTSTRRWVASWPISCATVFWR